MNKALFLDRDGVINIDHGYVYQKEDFEFVDGIFDLCRLAIAKGYQIFVITNQAGIASGYYSIEDFNQLTTWMVNEFAKQGIKITQVYYCPHHPNRGDNQYVQICQCRKPAPGMIIQAQQDHTIDLSASIFVGDKMSDMQAAEAAGVKHKILLSSRYHQQEEQLNSVNSSADCTADGHVNHIINIIHVDNINKVAENLPIS